MKFLIVDDDFGSRGGMAMTLKASYPEAKVYEATTVKEAISVLHGSGGIDLVLLDLNLEDSRGIDTLRAVKAWCEAHDVNPRIVVVSAAADYDDTLIPEAIEHCATGFITKGTTVEVFRSAVDLTLAGSIYIPDRYLRASARSRTAPPVSSRGAEEVNFTPREREVAALLVQGLSYKQIARRLSGSTGSLSDHTVRVHVQRMAWKLRVSDEAGGASLPAKAAVVTAFAERRLRFS